MRPFLLVQDPSTRLQPGPYVLLDVVFVFVTPIYQFLGHHLQRVLGDFDRFLVVEEVPCDIVQKGEYLPFMFFFGLAFLPLRLFLL